MCSQSLLDLTPINLDDLYKSPNSSFCNILHSLLQIFQVQTKIMNVSSQYISEAHKYRLTINKGRSGQGTEIQASSI